MNRKWIEKNNGDAKRDLMRAMLKMRMTLGVENYSTAEILGLVRKCAAISKFF